MQPACPQRGESPRMRSPKQHRCDHGLPELEGRHVVVGAVVNNIVERERPSIDSASVRFPLVHPSGRPATEVEIKRTQAHTADSFIALSTVTFFPLDDSPQELRPERAICQADGLIPQPNNEDLGADVALLRTFPRLLLTGQPLANERRYGERRRRTGNERPAEPQQHEGSGYEKSQTKDAKEEVEASSDVHAMIGFRMAFMKSSPSSTPATRARPIAMIKVTGPSILQLGSLSFSLRG